jgi:hypothetical protein
VSPSPDGNIRFAIVAETEQAELELELFEEEETPNYRFVTRGRKRVQVRRGEHAGVKDATDFFYHDPPVIWFSDGSSLEGNQY